MSRSPVSSSVLSLLDACAATIGSEGAPSATAAGRRTILVLRSLLESAGQQGGRAGGAAASPLSLAIGERFYPLKHCLDTAVTGRRPSTSTAGFSEYVANVWRCRTLLFQLASGEGPGASSVHTRLDVAGERGCRRLLGWGGGACVVSSFRSPMPV